jgi:hypothetical protein
MFKLILIIPCIIFLILLSAVLNVLFLTKHTQYALRGATGMRGPMLHSQTPKFITRNEVLILQAINLGKKYSASNSLSRILLEAENRSKANIPCDFNLVSPKSPGMTPFDLVNAYYDILNPWLTKLAIQSDKLLSLETQTDIKKLRQDLQNFLATEILKFYYSHEDYKIVKEYLIGVYQIVDTLIPR